MRLFSNLNPHSIHPIQKSIIEKLIFNPQLRFSQLKGKDTSSDLFTYHLKKLLGKKVIKKEGKHYTLTQKGRLYCQEFDSLTMAACRRPQLLAMCVAQKDNKYLITKRAKTPFYGYSSFPVGKVQFGEATKQAAKRFFAEETGLSGKFKQLGTIHEFNYNKEGKIIRDAYFFVFSVKHPQGQLKKLTSEGENYWQTEDEIKKTDKFFHSDKAWALSWAKENKDRLRFAEFRAPEKP